ncbi:helix-turn-helix domain-containing protein [Saccharopolyspora shandongensis]|uniref:helix-turn-helix domain-containing protein n=1 Tax=Saccharopolyspora shandongensis TaxID=418495 RepID=UPI000B874815|nr:helix-turn-helix domain-containing protein [Saccharopolyspora shandongensis]
MNKHHSCGDANAPNPDAVSAAAELAEAAHELAEAIRALAEHAPRDPDALLTAEQLGHLLRLSPRTLKEQAAAGAIPHRRFGKHYRFSREDAAEIVRRAGRTATPGRSRLRIA